QHPLLDGGVVREPDPASDADARGVAGVRPRGRVRRGHPRGDPHPQGDPGHQRAVEGGRPGAPRLGAPMSVDHGPETTDPAGSDARAEAPAIRRVLVVVAHPDDETLTAGALLAELAAHCPVTLVTSTRGERGEVIGADLAHLADD